MKRFKFFLPVLLFVSCFNEYKSDGCICNYSVSIGDENISISRSDLERSIGSVLKLSKDSPYLLDIVIFYYSSGKEVFSYSGSENKPLEKIYPGRIDALIKIKSGSNLVKAVTLSASGNSKEEVLNNFSAELKRNFCK